MGDRAVGWLAFFGGLLAALLLALIIVLISGDDAGDPAAASTSSTPGTGEPETSIGADTTAAPATTAGADTTVAPTTAAPATTVAPATTSAPVNRCAGLDPASFPADRVDLGGANGVFGGGPEPESVQDADIALLFESGGSFYVAFSLNVGYSAIAPLPEPSNPGFTPELLVVNFDGGDDGAWVKIDRSLASGADVYAFYYLDENCEIEDAGTDDVPRYEFLDWLGAQHTQGFHCDGMGVYETVAGATGDPSMWEITTTYFEWTAPQAPGWSIQSQEAVTVPDDDPQVTAAGQVDC